MGCIPMVFLCQYRSPDSCQQAVVCALFSFCCPAMDFQQDKDAFTAKSSTNMLSRFPLFHEAWLICTLVAASSRLVHAQAIHVSYLC